MNRRQNVAIDNHCRLSIETMRPEFGAAACCQAA